MNIKGTAVRALTNYINKYHPQLYEEWLMKLPADSKRLFYQTILPSEWYPLYEAAVQPIITLAELLHKNDEEVAFEVGQYSAQEALTGVYKFFASLAKPTYIVKRASIMFGTYYDPVEADYESLDQRKVMLVFGKHKHNEVLIYHRVKGWIHELVVITQKTEPKIELSTIDHMNGLYSGKFVIEW